MAGGSKVEICKSISASRRISFRREKAHPAFIVDELAAMVTKATQASYKVMADEPIEGCDRRHIDDPFGIRIELIEPYAK
jgi:hypothetical protein